ncbi:hypothetical protein RhiTH_002617 [Rhizoctonia solani]
MEVAANLRGRQADELTSTPRLAKVLDIPGLDNLRTYYAATMALVQGSPARPGLPPELVIYICRLADFEVVRITRSPEGIKEVRAWSPKIESRLWFQTKPLKKPILSRIKSIQLITMSRHQGWVNNRSGGSWSWFEVRIACPGDENPSQFEAKLRGDGYDASWRSHSNPVEQEASSQEIEFTEHRGLLFGTDNQLWHEIKEGDALQVVLKAQFSGWANIASDGALKIVTWWEPSPEMLDLLYNRSKKAGSWSWFEVRVAQPVDKGDTNRSEVKRHLDGSEMSWRSHAHPVDQETAQQQGNFAEHKGLVFDSDHELWDEVGEGDVLQVVMKVQFRGWANKASDGMLQISTWWEPSAEMLDMMGQSGKI